MKLTVILDGCPDEYKCLFDATFASLPGYSCIDTPAIGNHATYAQQLEILACDAKEAGCLYFSEDDYLYREESLAAMMEFLAQPDVDFVTPLDHPDLYMPEREFDTRSVVRVSNYCHWRDVASTCCTFMLKSVTFEKAKRSLAYYANGGSDYLMGLLLTKKGVFSPRTVVGGAMRFVFHRGEWQNAVPALAWAKLGLRLVAAHSFRLWAPMPTLAVHLCVPSLPPLHDAVALNKGAP